MPFPYRLWLFIVFQAFFNILGFSQVAVTTKDFSLFSDENAILTNAILFVFYLHFKFFIFKIRDSLELLIFTLNQIPLLLDFGINWLKSRGKKPKGERNLVTYQVCLFAKSRGKRRKSAFAFLTKTGNCQTGLRTILRKRQKSKKPPKRRVKI